MRTSCIRGVAAQLLIVLWVGLAPGPTARAAEASNDGPQPGITPRTGEPVALDVTLRDEAGRAVRVRDLVDRPTLLLFVYYRCPSICDPLLRALAHTLGQVSLALGDRYRVLTVSFDPDETPDVAAVKKGEILALLPAPPPQDAWRFLTGDEPELRRLTASAGFAYRYDARTGAYVHASALLALSADGRIVRTLEGLVFMPAQIELALADAASGTGRDFLQSVQLLCYAYEPGSGYVLQVHRLVLAVSAALVLLIVAVLLPGRRRRPPAEPQPQGDPAP